MLVKHTDSKKRAFAFEKKKTPKNIKSQPADHFSPDTLNTFSFFAQQIYIYVSQP